MTLLFGELLDDFVSAEEVAADEAQDPIVWIVLMWN